MSKRRLASRPRTSDGYCSTVSKLRYATKDRAEEALATVDELSRAAHWGGPREVRAYECPWCHGWHLTSKAELPA
jgi:hypothetical protein